MQELKIKQEFQKLIPPLSEHEKEGLEAEIRYWARCYSPIITWKGYIADGHHRYAICQKYGLPFKTEELDIDSEISVKRWMIRNQMDSRRNLPLHSKLDLAFEDEKLEQEEAKERQELTQFQKKITARQPVASPQKLFENCEENKGKTMEKVAEKAGCSHETARQYKKVKEAGLRERVVNGESIKKVCREIQKAEKLQTLQTAQFPEGKYRVIYADPPWQYNDQRAPGNGGAEEHYPTMPLEDICNLPVEDLAEDNSVLFLWATTPLLPEAFTVMKSWGFDYKSMLVWDKEVGFYGNYLSVCQELLLLGTKGSCLPDCDTRICSIIRQKKEKHSEKPERFREIIDGMYKYGNRIELFARKETKGWEAYGNEV